MIELLNAPDPDAPDLTDMTKAELLQYAADIGADGVSSSMKKAEILAVLQGG